ncbi:MAG: hypothetical protein ChlgKO_10980 [Chlamydiales bacterium]
MRQALIKTLVEQLGYPPELLVVEKELCLLPHLHFQEGVPQRRVDLLAYHKVENELVPLLLIECKAIKADRKALEQVMGYNHFVGAPFVAVVSKEARLTGWQGVAGLEISQGLYRYDDLLATHRQ